MVGQIYGYLSRNLPILKYANHGNPVVTISINNTLIRDTLIDIGAAINIMTWNTMEMLKLGPLLRPTPTILELADHTPVKPIGVVNDIIVTLASWKYHVYLLIIYSRYPTKGKLIILGRPWLATTNAFIGYRAGEMSISNGISTKTLILYPPTQLVKETLSWLEDPFGDENLEEPLLSLDHSRALHEKNDYIFSEEYQTHYDPTTSTSTSVIFSIDEQQGPHALSFEISFGKLLHINSGLTLEQQEQLVKILQEKSGTFALEYSDMRVIRPKNCIHHIYI